MSERIYAWLLRLLPSQFQHAYQEEALQLFRDRSRDERGFFARLRLWLDLLADLAVSLARGYGDFQPRLAAGPVPASADRVPSFELLAAESPRRGALIAGSVLSLVTLSAVPFSINNFRNYPPPRGTAFGPRSLPYG